MYWVHVAEGSVVVVEPHVWSARFVPQLDEEGRSGTGNEATALAPTAALTTKPGCRARKRPPGQRLVQDDVDC